MFGTDKPLGFQAGDANLYRYVNNSPTNATDPSGLDALPVSPDGPDGVPVDPQPGSLSTVQTRDWYNARVRAEIPALEAQLRAQGKTLPEIHEAVSTLRTQLMLRARELMQDRALAASLPTPRTPAQVLAEHGGNYEASIAAARRTNPTVNAQVEQLRSQMPTSPSTGPLATTPIPPSPQLNAARGSVGAQIQGVGVASVGAAVLDMRDNLNRIAAQGGPQAAVAQQYGLSVDLIYRLEAVYGSVADFLGQTHNNAPVVIARFREDLANLNGAYSQLTGNTFASGHGMPWSSGAAADRIGRLRLSLQDLELLTTQTQTGPNSFRESFVNLQNANRPLQERRVNPDYDHWYYFGYNLYYDTPRQVAEQNRNTAIANNITGLLNQLRPR